MTRIARDLPFGNGRRLVERIGALLDENSQQCAAQAFSHGPTLERRGWRDLFAVPLGDDLPFVRHDEGGSHPSRLEGCVHCLAHPGDIHVRGWPARRKEIAHRPGLRLRIGQCAFHDRRLEEDIGLADRKRDASLAAELLRDSNRSVGHRHFDRPLFAVDLWPAEPGALAIWRGEVADILRGKRGIESRDEDSRAHDLRVAGGVVFQRVAWWRHVGRVQFQRLRARDERLASIRNLRDECY